MSRRFPTPFEEAVQRQLAVLRKDGAEDLSAARVMCLMGLVSDYGYSAVAKYLGVHRNTLGNWFRKIKTGTVRSRRGRPRSIRPDNTILIAALSICGVPTRLIAEVVQISPSAVKRQLLENALHERIQRLTREEHERIVAFIPEIAEWLRQRGVKTNNRLSIGSHLAKHEHAGTHHLNIHLHVAVSNANKVAVRAAYFFPRPVVYEAMREVDDRRARGGGNAASMLWRVLKRKATEHKIYLGLDPRRVLRLEGMQPGDLEVACDCTRNLGPQHRSTTAHGDLSESR